ncbi:MAG: hypothetical protein FWH18_08395 [Marinilabiliaceae bacterium]|nr:hypothetical protein [Marinilabiliaceae bacterium]
MGRINLANSENLVKIVVQDKSGDKIIKNHINHSSDNLFQKKCYLCAKNKNGAIINGKITDFLQSK